MPRPLDVFRNSARRTLWLRRLAGLACLGALAVYTLAGCQAPSFANADWPDWASFRSQSPDEDEEKEDEDSGEGTKLDTPLIGEYVTAFGGTSLIAIEGVGLVTGLDNTGDDPPPSQYRTRLLEEMKKKGVEEPNKILASPKTAMVVVQAYLPVNVRKGDPFDVEVMLPPNSQATSLAGGWLVEARLSEQKVTGSGRLLDGDVFGTASGPILVSTGEGGTGNLRRGRILGGGKSKADRNLEVYVRNEYRSTRTTSRVATAIGKRFHGHDKHGSKVSMAEAKDDQKVLLKVPDEYKENYPRYLSVIRNMPFRETEMARRVRLQKLEDQLKVPATSETAALRLEGMGTEAVPALKRGLDHADLEVRFNAAMALTYMGETDGLDELVEAARVEPAFRVYALAALASSRDAMASTELRPLLGEESPETRYGAFRSLTVLNDRDPVVAGQEMKGNYTLHLVDKGGSPLAHMTHHTKAEVVLFGPEQRLQLPAVLRAGPHIQVNGQQGSDEVIVSRYSGGKNERRAVSPKLADIIRACDELGAHYPDIADLLTQAHKRHNLEGELAIDALPSAGRTYFAKNDKGEGGKRTIGNQYTAPGIFAPPSVDAANARNSDIKEVSADDKAGKKKADSEVRAASGEKEAGHVKNADAKTPTKEKDSASDSKEPAEAKEPELVGVDFDFKRQDTVDSETSTEGEEAEPSEEPEVAGKKKWFDPRGAFKKPEWLKGDVPEQWEPGAE